MGLPANQQVQLPAYIPLPLLASVLASAFLYGQPTAWRADAIRGDSWETTLLTGRPRPARSAAQACGAIFWRRLPW